jgi:hypothetical protein
MSRWLLLLLPVLFASCTGQKKEEEKGVRKTGPAFPYAFDYSKFEGVYEGDFSGSSIRIVLKHVSGAHATGYNLHKGLRRNMSGKMSFSGGRFQFSLNEPGDHKYDGVFQFTVDTVKYEAQGTWKPLNNDSLRPKTFLLSKKQEGYQEVFSDSVATVYFNADGLCTYEFYPIIDGKRSEQMVEINGNWTLKANEYIVDWEPNNVFSNRRSVFTTHEDSTEGGFIEYIKFGDRALYTEFF